ncbi:MAG: TetR/AcrR family transcriptional regulator [Pseudomonadota bacterium]
MSEDNRSLLRRRALEVAREIMSAEGLGAVQARRIATGIGCSVGTLYNLYDGLDDLIVAVNAETLEQLGAAVVKACDTSDSQAIEPLLEIMALAYFEFARDHRQCWQAIFQHQLANGRVVPDWYRERQSALFALVEDILRSRIRDDDHRKMASRALFSAVHGVVSLSLDEKLGAYDEHLTRKQITFIVGSAVRGLG